MAPAGTGIAARLLARNRIASAFFDREAPRLAAISSEMADRFGRGGRLLAFGRGPQATDAQHVAVEFVHPVIVGKRALPALDLSADPGTCLPALVRADDIVFGFGSTADDAWVAGLLDDARARGARTLALPGRSGEHGLEPSSGDPWIDQEILEVVYHTLWETVHVFLEHRAGGGDDLGDAAFLYPFLSTGPADTGHLLGEVADSIRAKAATVAQLRTQVAETQAGIMAAAADAMSDRVRRGGTLLLFGNGGSATDANDWALDCASRGVPALSLSSDPACVTAILNDVGREEVFLRQLIAHARPSDVAVAISTSGGSTNVIAALGEARRRGLLTVALTGYDGGDIRRGGHADHVVVVAGDAIPRIQEAQASIYHVLTEVMTARDERETTTGATTNRELYGTAACPATRELRDHLEWEGLPFEEYDVDTDTEARRRLDALTGGGRTVPVLVESGRVVSIGWRGRGCTVAPLPPAGG
jgi:D-sedoheptulose 7-phosphate isomerase